MPNKMLKMSANFEVKGIEKSQEDGEDILKISGYASTNDVDRHNDIIESTAWRGGLKNYKKNPIILGFHKQDLPIGKAIEIENDDKGLKITAVISKAAGNIYELIKEGILSTFSVGFIAKDLDYDENVGVYKITKAELFEVSVVSIPANASAGFSLMKNFQNMGEFDQFKKELNLNVKKETDLMPQEIDLAEIATKAAEQAAKAVRAQIAAEEAEKARVAAEEKKQKEAVDIQVKTAAERIAEELAAKFAEKDAARDAEIKELKKAAAEEKEELLAMWRSKGSNKEIHGESGSRKEAFSKDEKDTAIILTKVYGKPIETFKYFQELKKKSGGEHWDSSVELADWETEFNTRVHNDMREQLVVEPLFKTMPMKTRTFDFPVNPEAEPATWINESAYRSSDKSSTGTARDHKLKDNSITAYKLAAKEYIGYEEEEDTIVAIMPIIRESISRGMALASDTAVLRGQGSLTSSDYDPILGIVNRGTNDVDLSYASGSDFTSVFNYDNVVDARKNLGTYGHNPRNLKLIVSQDSYFAMLKWEEFQTVDKIGNVASLLTGQVGAVGAIPVILSMAYEAADTGVAVASLVYTGNFIVGNLRNTMTENDTDIENQYRIIVSTRRFGFTALSVGQGVVNINA